MRDALSDTVAPGVVLPLRKCEWFHTPAQRGLDLCLPCEKRWTSKLEVPFGAGPEAECVLGIHRAVGNLW